MASRNDRPRDRARGERPAGHVWRAAAEDGLARIVAAGRAGYDRRRTLLRLIGLDAGDLDRDGDALDRAIRARLTRALRAERRRGRAGHWAYDLDRHVALLQALEAEAQAARGAGRPGPARDDAADGRERKTPPGEAGRRL